MPPTAQSLVLDMLSTLRGQSMPVSALVAVAEVFDISENNLRVALARLVSRGLVERSDRGWYGLAEAARAVQSHVTSWSDIERRVVKWRGDWIAVHTADLPRLRGSAARRRERALDFLGFRELRAGLLLRPANLSGGVDGVRERLYALGLEASAPVFRIDSFDDDTDAAARALWNADEVRAGYRATMQRLERSGRRLANQPIETTMVECFEQGGAALRQIAFDPLLPEPLLPAADRRAFVDAVRRYDSLGWTFWNRFMREHGAALRDSPLKIRFVDTTRTAA